MNTTHRFGGDWTEEKLKRLKKYLDAYMVIFSQNERARALKPIYVDAFAGTGYRDVRENENNDPLLPFPNDDEIVSYQKGSAQIALDLEYPFKEYIFIEQSPEFYAELEKLKQEYSGSRNIKVVQEDANSYLQRWCRETNWRSSRAVIFLDPYGMQVKWKTLQAIANTKAIDLWILFPLGQAVNRLLTKDCPPEGAWAEKLTNFFGEDKWKSEFYKKYKQKSLFENQEGYKKTADFKAIGQYFNDRLKTIFKGVAKVPLPLYNSKGVPIFLFCFAASNEKGAPTAVKSAQDVLLKEL